MGVPVDKRVLDLFEAESVNTLFGIPDPNFVHMFARAHVRRSRCPLPGRPAGTHHRTPAVVHVCIDPKANSEEMPKYDEFRTWCAEGTQ
jgi:hypothetical protein